MRLIKGRLSDGIVHIVLDVAGHIDDDRRASVDEAYCGEKGYMEQVTLPVTCLVCTVEHSNP